MSDIDTKVIRSNRIAKDYTKGKRQIELARAHGIDRTEEELGRYKKRSWCACGSSRCVMCGNPRKIFNLKTSKEISFEEVNRHYDYSDSSEL